jgi:cobaltochelatase CobS
MLVNGSMSYVHGSLSQAVRDGHLLILNEIDLMDPSELAGLNDIIEGQTQLLNILCNPYHQQYGLDMR